MLQPDLRWRVCIACFLQLAQQFTGINGFTTLVGVRAWVRGWGCVVGCVRACVVGWLGACACVGAGGGGWMSAWVDGCMGETSEYKESVHARNTGPSVYGEATTATYPSATDCHHTHTRSCLRAL
jgi:hypothetical protein